MPFVTVRTVRGLLNDQQKTELQKKITDVMVEVEGRGNEAFRNYVWVLVEEEDAGNWSIGGATLTPEAIARINSGGKS